MYVSLFGKNKEGKEYQVVLLCQKQDVKRLQKKTGDKYAQIKELIDIGLTTLKNYEAEPTFFIIWEKYIYQSMDKFTPEYIYKKLYEPSV